MPIYNGERFLSKAVDSILAQTFEDFELIISDNASTDGTAEICRHYASRDPRVRYIPHPVNRGAAWNNNHVVTLAQAEYFKWAHADDMIAPNHLECCIIEFDRAPASVALVSSQSMIIDEDDRPIRPCQDRMDLRQPRPSDRLTQAVRNARWCNVLFGLIRTRVLRACRPLGDYPWSDHALIHELALRGQIWEIPGHLFHRRVHAVWTLDVMAGYMDAQSKAVRVHPQYRILTETMRAIRGADLSYSDALRCRVAFLREWFLHYQLLPIQRELKRVARACLRRSRDTVHSAVRKRDHASVR